MPENFYRFDKTEVESISALKGANSWYTINDAGNQPLFACHVVGSCLGGTTTFHRSRGDDQVLFRLEPKRKILNLTHYVSEGTSGARLATIGLFTSHGMKVSTPTDQELYRIVDPQGKLDKFMQDVLEGCCTAYAIVDGDRIIGNIERHPRPEQEHKEPPQGLFGKLLRSAMKALGRDWCIELKEDGRAISDPRPLLATMILLLEQTIASDQAN
ncbi:MAG: hypothetical protein WBQ78_08275 [Gammaproteobacteria bacterium]